MANKKVEGRDRFDDELKALNTGEHKVPHDYATIILHSRPDLTRRHIHDVRHGLRVDFDVLGEIKRVTRERAAALYLNAVPA
jgi:hypothetical protein